jgi:hypothetical protein
MLLAARARLKPARTPQLEAPATCPSYPRNLSGASAPTVALRPAHRASQPLATAALLLDSLNQTALHGALHPHPNRGPPAASQLILI